MSKIHSALNTPHGVIVQVTSEDQEAANLVAHVIQRELGKANFTTVTHTDHTGKGVAHTPEPTLYDEVKARRPELFSTPILVTQNLGALVSEDENEVPEPITEHAKDVTLVSP